MRELSGKGVMVTGGAGFIGSHLVEELAGHSPARLVAVDNFFLGKRENLADAQALFPDLVIAEQNSGDLEAMTALCEEHDISVLFNLAVIPLPTSLVRPRFCVRENVDTALAACELCRQGVVESLVHFSSSEIYGTAQSVPMGEDHPTRPLTPYAASKLAGDHLALSYVETFGIDAAIVRPFNNYGPRQNEREYAGVIPLAIRQTLAGEPVTIHGDGLQTRDYIYVKDTVAAAVECYRREGLAGRVINLGSGQEQPIGEMVRTIVGLSGGDPASVRHGPPRPADVRRHCADMALARELIDFHAATDMETGLAATVRWYLDTLPRGQQPPAA